MGITHSATPLHAGNHSENKLEYKFYDVNNGDPVTRYLDYFEGAENFG